MKETDSTRSPDDATDLPPPFLCQILNRKGEGETDATVGSGILITPGWVLTAKHVIHRRDQPGWNAPVDMYSDRCHGHPEPIEL